MPPPRLALLLLLLLLLLHPCAALPIRIVTGTPQPTAIAGRAPLPAPRRVPSPVPPGDALAALDGRCFSLTQGGYSYEVCPWRNVTQRNAEGSVHALLHVLLGIWGAPEALPAAAPRAAATVATIGGAVALPPTSAAPTAVAAAAVATVTRLQRYDDGCICIGAKRRTTLVSWVCGESHRVTEAREPVTCEYALSISAPEACEAAATPAVEEVLVGGAPTAGTSPTPTQTGVPAPAAPAAPAAPVWVEVDLAARLDAIDAKLALLLSAEARRCSAGGDGEVMASAALVGDEISDAAVAGGAVTGAAVAGGAAITDAAVMGGAITNAAVTDSAITDAAASSGVISDAEASATLQGEAVAATAASDGALDPDDVSASTLPATRADCAIISPLPSTGEGVTESGEGARVQ